jgi:hypothetical protein
VPRPPEAIDLLLGRLADLDQRMFRLWEDSHQWPRPVKRGYRSVRRELVEWQERAVPSLSGPDADEFSFLQFLYYIEMRVADLEALCHRATSSSSVPGTFVSSGLSLAAFMIPAADRERWRRAFGEDVEAASGRWAQLACLSRLLVRAPAVRRACVRGARLARKRRS